jgi:L-iditol 2-dehydrogenase
MLAARLHAARDVRLEQVPDPVIPGGWLLVRVRSCSICPSDWRLWDSGDAGGAPLTAPIIQGHEFAGDVVSGPGGAPDVFPTGTRVAVEPSWHCGHCDACRRGLVNVCRNVIFPSFPPYNGGLAELVACPAFACYPLPGAVSYDEGAMIEPLGVAIHALRLAAPPAGGRAIILGAGVVGNCVAQLLRLRGVTDVTLAEPIGERRALAMAMGATRVVASPEGLVEGGTEAEVVYECSGYSGAVAEALPLVSPCGTLCVVGIPHPETVTFEANAPRRRELSLIFTRRSRNALAEAIELVASGKVDLRVLPVRHYPLTETNAALAATGERPGDMLRAIVHP